MSDTAAPQGRAAPEKAVVLLVPEELGDLNDLSRLRATLTRWGSAFRLLICLSDRPAPALVTLAAELGIETEILLSPAAEWPPTTAYTLRAPPGIKVGDLLEFALALADVLFAADPSRQSALVKTAAKLGKPIATFDGAAPVLPRLSTVTHHLDPQQTGWRGRLRPCFGRFEQAIVEVLAFAWLGWHKDGLAESRKKLRRALREKAWPPPPYFAGSELTPDTAARAPDAPIVACFDIMDRCALYGSFIHRDLAWFAHLGAAFAVLFAVAGQLAHGAAAWGLAELAVLLVVGGLVLWARGSALQDRWTACRLGAEQLRIARMSLPLLVLPRALAVTDAPPAGTAQSGKPLPYDFRALAEVKRSVRAHGLPRLAADFTPARAAAWLKIVVDDQIKYHHINHRKLERAEKRLSYAARIIFAAAIVAVLWHFCSHAEWLLLVTAAGPAFAAALHGAGTRLGIVHRAELSHGIEQELKPIESALDRLMNSEPGEQTWQEVRQLAFAATELMGSENTSWHGLVRRYRDELP